MALGLLGLALLLAIVFQAVRMAARQLRRGQLLVPLLFAQYIVGAQFSGAIWGASALWACTALLLGSRSFGKSTNPAARRVFRSRRHGARRPDSLPIPAPQPSGND
jgi:hypothetical protein